MKQKSKKRRLSKDSGSIANLPLVEPRAPKGTRPRLHCMYDLVLYADGQLVNNANQKDMRCIVEVKPSLPWSNGLATSLFMQMGWEMMFFIASSQEERLMKQRWVLIGQFGTQVFLVVATFAQPWLDYISGKDPTHDHHDDGFLHLHLAGPLNVFNYKHVKLLGKFVVTFTKQQMSDLSR